VGASGAVATSPDGETWTQHTAAQSNTWSGVCYGMGMFVAVSANGTDRVMTSVDGEIWTSQATPIPASVWRSVAFSPEHQRFVAVAGSGDYTLIMFSDDAETWTQTAIGQYLGYQLWTVCWSKAFNAWYAP